MAQSLEWGGWRGGYSPAPPPFRNRPRPVPLDLAAESTFLAWVHADTPQTLQEFAAAEWTNLPDVPPPPPPMTLR